MVYLSYISENEPDCDQKSSAGTDTGETNVEELPGKLLFYFSLMFQMVLV